MINSFSYTYPRQNNPLKKVLSEGGFTPPIATEELPVGGFGLGHNVYNNYYNYNHVYQLYK